MRARAFTKVVIGVALVVGVITTSCGTPRQEPPIPTADFTPQAVLEIGPQATRWIVHGPSVVADGATATVPHDSVIEVANATDMTIRVQGDGGLAFDTGRMLAGERTTIALTEQVDAPKTVRISVDGMDLEAKLVITPSTR
ncbi:MAG: hypothetical protein N2037_10025 [Acidimicrobiales bacterium]|nr:hypothetical protein [Acidimicrobiales bacterium]